MRFSEIIKKWENGWRGIAVDSYGNDFDFTKETLSTADILNDTIDVITYVDEKWSIKEEKRLEPLTVTINATINADSLNDINKVIDELQKKLSNLQINTTLK